MVGIDILDMLSHAEKDQEMTAWYDSRPRILFYLMRTWVSVTGSGRNND